MKIYSKRINVFQILYYIVCNRFQILNACFQFVAGQAYTDHTVRFEHRMLLLRQKTLSCLMFPDIWSYSLKFLLYQMEKKYNCKFHQYVKNSKVRQVKRVNCKNYWVRIIGTGRLRQKKHRWYAMALVAWMSKNDLQISLFV